MLDLTLLKQQRADIRSAWAALGGGRLRGNRGQAFWRNGDGFSVSLDARRDLWHDHRDGVGGDVISLVQVARNCDFRAAAEWLASFTGMDLGTPSRRDKLADTDWVADLRRAAWWARTAAATAEQSLEDFVSSSHHMPNRAPLTALLRTIRLGDAALITEYREWRRQNPKLTAALVRAGQNSTARLQRRLARRLAEHCG